VLQGVELALYRGRGSAGEAAMGGNDQQLLVLTPLMVGRGYEGVYTRDSRQRWLIA
jgi:hypothetical protein